MSEARNESLLDKLQGILDSVEALEAELRLLMDSIQGEED